MLLQKHLAAGNIASRIVFHPSSELKVILNDWRSRRKIDRITEIYLLMADRHDHVRQQILPALTAGTWIISLRSWFSAAVYQANNPSEAEWVKTQFGHFEPPADLVFYFDIIPDLALKRIKVRHDKTGEPIGKFENQTDLSQKRDRYLEVMKSVSHVVIDAADDIESISARIWDSVKSGLF